MSLETPGCPLWRLLGRLLPELWEIVIPSSALKDAYCLVKALYHVELEDEADELAEMSDQAGQQAHSPPPLPQQQQQQHWSSLPMADEAPIQQQQQQQSGSAVISDQASATDQASTQQQQQQQSRLGAHFARRRARRASRPHRVRTFVCSSVGVRHYEIWEYC